MLDTLELERQLRLRWRSIHGIRSIVVRSVQGVWAVIAAGPAPQHPQALPSTVTVNTGQRFPAVLPVYWQQVAAAAPRVLPPSEAAAQRLANNQLWQGDVATPDRPMDLLTYQHAPQVGGGTKLPSAPYDEYQVFLPARTPELPFWSEPCDMRSCFCFYYFSRSQLVLTTTIPADRQLTLRGISYSATGIPAGHAIDVRVSRSGATLTSWRDMMATPGGDPANQFTFSGHLNPMPLNAIIDHDQTLTVDVTLLGPPPFNLPPTYPTTAEVCVLLRGWMSRLNDTRAGAPRPFDLGDPNTLAQGNLEIVDSFRDEALLESVQQVLNAGEYEVKHPETHGKR